MKDFRKVIAVCTMNFTDDPCVHYDPKGPLKWCKHCKHNASFGLRLCRREVDRDA